MNTPVASTSAINGAILPLNAGTIGLRRDPTTEQQMRQAIRDLVTSVDPYAMLDVEAETVCLLFTYISYQSVF